MNRRQWRESLRRLVMRTNIAVREDRPQARVEAPMWLLADIAATGEAARRRTPWL
ncbi:hypothetical protein [Amycolatopsis lurida]|uniref:hypothetical protein n=1 Tax=Amycolatopsis lurida TaxID=31959 RepID=UPI0036665663